MNLIENIEFTSIDLTKFGLLIIAVVAMLHITPLSLLVVLPILVVMLYTVLDEIRKGTLVSETKNT